MVTSGSKYLDCSHSDCMFPTASFVQRSLAGHQNALQQTDLETDLEQDQTENVLSSWQFNGRKSKVHLNLQNRLDLHSHSESHCDAASLK